MSVTHKHSPPPGSVAHEKTPAHGGDEFAVTLQTKKVLLFEQKKVPLAGGNLNCIFGSRIPNRATFRTCVAVQSLQKILFFVGLMV